MAVVSERPDAWWWHRIVGHAHAATRLRAGGQRRTAFGWMVHRDDAPWLWAVNRAQVQPGAGGLAPEALVEAVEAAHAERGLRHRALDVRNPADARALSPALTAAGWTAIDLAVLAARPVALVRATAGAAAHAGVRVAAEPPAAAVPARRPAQDVELAWAPAAERDRVAAQWVAVPAPDTAHLLARDEAGTPVGAAVLHLGATHVEVDDLVVTPARRGQGIGTALLAAAAALAAERNAGRIGLHADRDGRPLRWYRRLGLAELGAAVGAFRAPAL